MAGAADKSSSATAARVLGDNSRSLRDDKFLRAGNTCQMSAVMRSFSHLDFDSRMILQEKLMRRFNRNLFMDAVRYDLSPCSDGAWSEEKSSVLELADFGLLLKTIPSNQCKIGFVAKQCGMKRLGAFIDFYAVPENQKKSFLEDKDKFFVSALMAEENTFSGAGFLFQLDEWLRFKDQFRQDVEQYRDHHPDFDYRSDLFRAYIMRQAQILNNVPSSRHR
ncbi:MAG: hypothetical protein IJV07_04310 [Alphaproteobacteria bacterium]|nr:hypothetical protein [Alphaproteobacteria bacterium]